MPLMPTPNKGGGGVLRQRQKKIPVKKYVVERKRKNDID